MDAVAKNNIQRLEIRSQGDECVFSSGSYQFAVEAVPSPKDIFKCKICAFVRVDFMVLGI
jgi:hypothetical protein